MTTTKFGEGDHVLYRARSGALLPGTIIGTGIEAGVVVYDVELEDGGETKWGYADQFELVSSYDGPTDDQTYNGVGIEGGVRYGQ